MPCSWRPRDHFVKRRPSSLQMCSLRSRQHAVNLRSRKARPSCVLGASIGPCTHTRKHAASPVTGSEKEAIKFKLRIMRSGVSEPCPHVCRLSGFYRGLASPGDALDDQRPQGRGCSGCASARLAAFARSQKVSERGEHATWRARSADFLTTHSADFLTQTLLHSMGFAASTTQQERTIKGSCSINGLGS